MTKQEIIDLIQVETLSLLNLKQDRAKDIETYIDLWEEHKKDLTND